MISSASLSVGQRTRRASLAVSPPGSSKEPAGSNSRPSAAGGDSKSRLMARAWR